MKFGPLLTKLVLCCLAGLGAAHNAPCASTPDREFRMAMQSSRVKVGCLVRVSAPGVPQDPSCASMLNLWKVSRQYYAANSGGFLKDLLSELNRVRTLESYRYSPILVAALSELGELKGELERISAKEIKEQWRFKFATKALERKNTGKCLDDNEPAYAEICNFKDQEFTRLRLMNERGSP